MKLRRFREPPRMGMNMTPMIDIVFLLIIFFMTVSQITQSLDEPINLPNVGPDGRPLETVRVTINLSASGTKIVAGRVYEMPDLKQALQNEIGRVGQASQLRVLVRCDRNCPGQHINELSEELAKLGIPSMRISVRGNDPQ